MDSKILGTRIDPIGLDDAVDRTKEWVRSGETHYVCVANVHMVMEAYDSPDFRNLVNAADLVVADGMPLVWTLRQMGSVKQERVYGPELMLRLLLTAAEKGIPVGFLGSTSKVIELLVKNVRQRFPAVQITYAVSPPFHPISTDEDEAIIKEINNSGAGILFVGLGCPKQEKWMATHDGRVKAVMVGVGAAFDFIAGTKKQAPKWMQRSGLEWFYRFIHEPDRLWRRYLYHNPRFVLLVMLPTLIRRVSRLKI